MTARKRLSCAIAALIASIGCQTTNAGPTPPRPLITLQEESSKLIYLSDENGNRIIDFSHAGYRGGDAPIPTVPAVIAIGQPQQDNTDIIQAAIDQLAKKQPDKDGFRGAVQLSPGVYPVSGQIRVNASGVVLRGAGAIEGGTTLLATGTDRRPLITIGGKNDRKVAATQPISQSYVPVNSMQVTLSTNHEIKAGDSIVIRRPSTAAWIVEMKMDDFGGDRHGDSWKAGSRDIEWDRVVTKVTGTTVTFDAPITAALDSAFGGGVIATYTWQGRVSNSGVENLKCESQFDKSNPKDEDHSWYAVTIENASDCWVRRMTATGFSGSAVAVWESANRITVEDCKYLAPVSEIGGWRRNAFFTMGQQVLMQRLYSEDARHDFAVGYNAAGPNAFVQCESVRSLGESGAIDSWACGTLFDMVRIDGKELSLSNRGFRGKGQGWSAANSVLWNCSAAVIDCPKPPTAQNYAIGTWGEFNGDGYWYASNDDPVAESLYYAQRADRLKKRDARLMLSSGEASSSPSLDAAAQAVKEAYKPRQSLSEFIDEIATIDPIPYVKDLEIAAAPTPAANDKPNKELKVVNGWLTIDGAAVMGGAPASPWWNGSLRSADTRSDSPALTRFVPGRTGPRFTDDIDQVVETLKSKNNAGFQQHPPLWYDRRRDDHERVLRADGDVVAPFYEWPFARSGIGTAYDGLSKYDLTKPNPFYYSRLQTFARKAAPHGLLLINMHYMQHSILEAGAHYADYPWRSANNINHMKLPEPPNYAGDKRIFIGEQFYDVTVPERAALHKQYIRTQLDQLKDSPNVIHLTSDEFTGDLRFVQFWVDTIADWEKETGRHAIIGLYAPKNVTDSILADSKRSPTIDLIYNSYDPAEAGFWYQPDGTPYAPDGGLNLAPRQLLRALKPKNAGFAQVYKMAFEYRTKYPDKPFVYRGDANLAWAAVMGGASLITLDADLNADFRAALARTKPVVDKGDDDKTRAYVLANDGHDFILYAGDRPLPKLGKAGFTYTARALNPRTGEVTPLPDIKATQDIVNIKAPFSPAVIWLHAD